MIQGVIQILLDASAVTSEVGNNKGNHKPKIYPVVCPQPEESPYITVSKISTNPDGCKVSTLDEVNFTVLHYSKNYNKADAMHEATRAALEVIQDHTELGFEFADIRFVTDRDLFDNEAQLYVRQADYRAMIRR
jgi:hypothetical protein